MTTLNARANAAWHKAVAVGDVLDSEVAWEDGYKAARQEAGQEGMGGEDHAADHVGLVSNQPKGEQASGALLARLEAIQASRQTDAERFAVGLCIAALADAVTPLLGPRPLLDRDVLDRRLETAKGHSWSIETTVDAVMELARPTPTREQIATILRDHTWIGSEHRCSCGDEYVEFVSHHQAEAVLALLNGAD